MGLRTKVLSVSDRFSSAWRVIVKRGSPTLESVTRQLERIQQQLESVKDVPPPAAEADREHQERKDRLKAIGDLRGFEWKVYSQNGEDGILLEIFRRIGTTNCFFVEFGVESGVQCNSRYLVEYKDWSGVYFESTDSDVAKLKTMHQDNPKIQVVQTCVTSANFEQLLKAAQVPHDLDLLSIDIDSNDYWVWKSLEGWRPRVVVIEYNAFHDPPAKWVMKENLEYRWNQTTYYGASFASLCHLGRSKGYTPVGTDPNGVNLFFVRNDCMNDQFMDAEMHYLFQPFGYSRPPTGTGPYVEI